VLVLVPREVVDSVHVAPVDSGGNIFLLDDIPSVGSGLDSTLNFKGSSLNTASLLSGGLEEGLLLHLARFEVVSRLGELVYCLVVSRIDLLNLSSVVPSLVSPGVLGSYPRAVFLDSNVVSSSADLSKALITPVLSPRVSNEPVLLSILDTVADDGNGVYLLLIASGIAVNTISREGFKRFRDCDSTSNRSALSNLLHHVLLSLDVTVLVCLISLVGIRDDTSFSRAAVSALLHSRALLSVVVTTSLVDRASSIGHLVIGHPLEGSEVVSTMASEHVVLARDQDLRRDVDIRPGSLTHNLHAVGEDRSSGMGPARSTVLRDVLVEDVGKEVCSVSSFLSNVVPENFFREVSKVNKRLSNVLENGALRLSEVRVFTVDVKASAYGGTEHSCNCE